MSKVRKNIGVLGMVAAFIFLAGGLASVTLAQEKKMSDSAQIVKQPSKISFSVSEFESEARAAQAVVCGTPITDIDGYTYPTVQIGAQCWMAENLKTKTKPNGQLLTNLFDGSERDCISPTQETRGTEMNCAAGYALYTWPAAMNASTMPGATGICPAGWHIPTDEEWHALELFLAKPGQTCDPKRNSWDGWDCIPAGDQLKVGGGSGFNGILTGFRATANEFFHGIGHAIFWSSSSETNAVWTRSLFGDDISGVAREGNLGGFQPAAAANVRCIRN